MCVTNATAFRKNLFSIVDDTVKYNETVHICTKNGDAVLISKEEYDGLVATSEIMSSPKLYNKIVKGMNEAVEDCVAENEVDL